MERETDDFSGRLLGVREGLLCAGKMGEDGLLVQALAVVDSAGDVGGFEGFAEAVAILQADGVLCVDVGVAGVDRGHVDMIFE